MRLDLISRACSCFKTVVQDCEVLVLVLVLVFLPLPDFTEVLRAETLLFPIPFAGMGNLPCPGLVLFILQELVSRSPLIPGSSPFKADIRSKHVKRRSGSFKVKGMNANLKNKEVPFFTE